MVTQVELETAFMIGIPHSRQMVASNKTWSRYFLNTCQKHYHARYRLFGWF